MFENEINQNWISTQTTVNFTERVASCRTHIYATSLLSLGLIN